RRNHAVEAVFGQLGKDGPRVPLEDRPPHARADLALGVGRGQDCCRGELTVAVRPGRTVPTHAVCCRGELTVAVRPGRTVPTHAGTLRPSYRPGEPRSTVRPPNSLPSLLSPRPDNGRPPQS